MGTVFKDYHARLAKEGFVKALLLSLMVGFIVLLISATVFWLTAFKHFWLSLIFFGVVVGGMTPLLYYKKFKPTARAIAKRVDALGLEERLLTMTELEGDTSFIAMKQREDALKALKTVNAKLVPLAISVPLIVAVAVTGFFGVGMVTVSALSATGVIEDGKDLIDDLTEPELVEYEVIYEVEGDGFIEGEFFQVVEAGKDATPVLAEPEDGWMFIGWSDESADPYRQDLAVSESLVITAIFQEVEVEPQPEDGEGEDGQPGEGGGGEADASPSQPQEGQPGDPQQGTPNPGDGAGGSYEDYNQVIDGETYYGGSTYDNAYSDAMDGASGDGDISDGGKEIIGDYFDTIEK